ncbi:MAG: RHS repeat-associated core domain-containing protein, partial [Clostridia bacterium]|nr:RHS repeat-associated core domain-containing protein [Clostridia bacterium]
NGTKLVSYSYDAWGNFTTQYVNNGQFTSAAYNPFRYRGYYYDTDLGLYYLNSRYYDSTVGRFISADTTDILTATPMGLTDKNLYAYCDNNPITRVDNGGEFWNIIAGAVIGGAISLVSSVISEVIEGDFTWKDVGQIAISTAIGAAEGAAIAICPSASVAISAATSTADTLINGIIDGDSSEKLIINSLVSGMIGAAAGSGGSDFVKGGRLINDAMASLGNAIHKGVHPVVKKAARKTIKKAAKTIGRKYVSGQLEDFAYGGIYEFSSLCVRSIVHVYRG